MIFSLNTALKPTALKVMHDDKPVSYSWGNIDALHKWIEAMNKKQINASLGIEESKKYPLIWLAEDWLAKRIGPGIKFTNVNFYLSHNSKVESLNENRIPNFELLYSIGNDFIEELKKIAFIEENTISYFERASFNTTVANSTEKSSYSSDIWDTLILSLELTINNNSPNNCFK